MKNLNLITVNQAVAFLGAETIDKMFKQNKGLFEELVKDTNKLSAAKLFVTNYAKIEGKEGYFITNPEGVHAKLYATVKSELELERALEKQTTEAKANKIELLTKGLKSTISEVNDYKKEMQTNYDIIYNFAKSKSEDSIIRGLCSKNLDVAELSTHLFLSDIIKVVTKDAFDTTMLLRSLFTIAIKEEKKLLEFDAVARLEAKTKHQLLINAVALYAAKVAPFVEKFNTVENKAARKDASVKKANDISTGKSYAVVLSNHLQRCKNFYDTKQLNDDKQVCLMQVLETFLPEFIPQISQDDADKLLTLGYHPEGVQLLKLSPSMRTIQLQAEGAAIAAAKVAA